MAKVTIKRRNESERADGRAALYAVLNIERMKIRLPLDIAVTSAEWDPVGERIKGRSQEVKDKNLIISNTKAKISDILVRARLTGEPLTKESFLALYRRPGETLNFLEYARRHLAELRSALQPQTLRHHEAALRKLEAYNPSLRISEITPEWLQVYVAYSIEKVMLLVQAGADVNKAGNESDESAILSAIENNQMDILLYLLQNGADYTMKYMKGDYTSENTVYSECSILDKLRALAYPLDSEKHKQKMEVVNFLASKGWNYSKSPIPAWLIEWAKNEYPDNWKEYLARY